MAVYKKTYTRYDGPLTPQASRFLVLTRYALEEMRRSRFLTIFYIVTLIWPLICALLIYLHHNLGALKLLEADPSKLIPIDARFFLRYIGFQSMLAFFLNAFIGPGLVSPDLANNALPLYLARPFSRTEYVLGKLSVLVLLLSLMTWVPGLILFGMQSYYAESGWMAANARIAGALLLGSSIWILVLSFLSLAISASVKWKPAAGALLFGAFFVMAGFGAAMNEILRTRWGGLINIRTLMATVWVALFEPPERRGLGAVFFRIPESAKIPLWCAWAALLTICLLCLYMLARKIRGAEVVR